MAQLLLINPKVKPSRRKRKGVKAMKKRRSKAQVAATRKLVALNRAKGKRKSNPVGGKVMAKKRRSKRRSNPVSTLKSVRRHGKADSRKAFRKLGYSRNPAKRRRNPITGKLGGIVSNTIMPAAIGAGGALTLDLIWGYLPIPAVVKVGPMRHAAKGVGAIGLGMLAGMVLKKDTANALALGAMTVVMYNAAREAVASFAPNIALGEYLAISGDQLNLGEYMEGIEDQSNDSMDGIGMGSDEFTMQGMYENVGNSDEF